MKHVFVLLHISCTCMWCVNYCWHPYLILTHLSCVVLSSGLTSGLYFNDVMSLMTYMSDAKVSWQATMPFIMSFVMEAPCWHMVHETINCWFVVQLPGCVVILVLVMPIVCFHTVDWQLPATLIDLTLYVIGIQTNEIQ